MSSSIDAGYYADQAMKIGKTKCESSPTGKHKWVEKQKDWDQCKHCGENRYWK